MVRDKRTSTIAIVSALVVGICSTTGSADERGHLAVDLGMNTGQATLVRGATKRTFFFHVHKSGGTSVCRMAAANKMVASTSLNFNCNARTGEERNTLHWGSAEAQCRVLERYHTSQFLANEGGLPPEVYWPAEWKLATLIREPRARYYSQYLHVHNTLMAGKNAAEWSSSPKLKSLYPNPRTHPPPFAAFLENSSGFPDNVLVRYFCGDPTLPTRPVTYADLRRAMCNLRHIDVIMILEEDMDAFNTSLAWPLRERGGTQNSADSRLADLPEATLEMLQAKTRYDALLYRFASDLAKGERQLNWQDGAFPSWRNRTWRLRGQGDQPALGLLEAAACDESDRSWKRCSHACECSEAIAGQ